MEIYFTISLIIFVISFLNILPKKGFHNAIVTGVLVALFYPIAILIVIGYGVFNGLRK